MVNRACVCGLGSSVCDIVIKLQVSEEKVPPPADLLCCVEVASRIKNCMGTQLLDTQRACTHLCSALTKRNKLRIP